MAFDGHGTILEMSHHALVSGVFSVGFSICSDCESFLAGSVGVTTLALLSGH